jgi:uncharacterized OB-fold protein
VTEIDPYGDPITRPFWAAAERRKLVLQECAVCGASQLYPRPICLACESSDLAWVVASGNGVVYSLTTVRVPVLDGLEPPYVVGLVDLDEGPRLMTNLVDECQIGQRVTLAWRERDDAPPLPQFRPVDLGKE